MKKKLTIVLSVFFAMYLFQSCDSQKTILENVPADKLDNTFVISMKDTLKIELKTNPTTGFAWFVDNKIKPKIIKELSREFVKNKKTSEMVGSGGLEIIKYLPVKNGETYLHLVYKREDGKTDKEKYYKVIVK